MSRKKLETVRRGFLFSRQLDEKIFEIQNSLGLRNMTNTVEYCVNLAYKKEIDNYYNVQKGKSKNFMTPEERVRANADKYQARKEANNDLIEERGLRICNLLEGEIDTDPAGNTICRWNVYSKETPHYVSVGEFSRTISDLTEDLTQSQYREGSKEEIKRILKNQ